MGKISCFSWFYGKFSDLECYTGRLFVIIKFFDETHGVKCKSLFIYLFYKKANDI